MFKKLTISLYRNIYFEVLFYIVFILITFFVCDEEF